MDDFTTHTLADEFLADLDSEDEAQLETDNENAPQDGEAIDEEALAKRMAQDELARQFGGGNAMDAEQEPKFTYESVAEFATLAQSEHFATHMAAVEKFAAAAEAAAGAGTQHNGMSEEDPEYKIIVASNGIIGEIDAEIDEIYKFVRDLYAEKFPELESLVLHAMDYIRVVKAIGNELDLTQIDLTELLPANTIMVVSVTATTSTGKALDEKSLAKVMEACDVALVLEKAKMQILEYVESRMSSVAPNLSAVVGTSVAAKLMAAAGGLLALSKLPSCTILALGAKRKVLAGMSTATATARAGFLTECGLILKTPPDLRIRAGRVISGRCTLAARVDAYQTDPTGRVGQGFYEEIDAKINKWQEAPPGKKEKALDAPDMKKKNRRAGKRVRKQKEAMAVTELRKQANRVKFGEISDDTYRNREVQLGMLTSSGTGSKLRKRINEKVGKITVRKRQQKTSSGAVSGLASSLAFTPVQGLELENPQAASEQEAKRENSGYFAADSGFSFKVPEPVKKKRKVDVKKEEEKK